MTKQDLIHSMQSANDGSAFITVTELCRYLGKHSRERVKAQYLNGLDRIGKAYFVPDVAERIMQRRSI